MDLKPGDVVSGKDGSIRKIEYILDRNGIKLVKWINLKDRKEMGSTILSYFLRCIRK